jgi:hypothetical protein
MTDYGGYGAARAISTVVSFIGWLLCLVAVVALFVGLVNFQNGGFLAVVPSIGSGVSGLLLVMAGQLTRASVDTADYNREILAILKLRYQGVSLEEKTSVTTAPNIEQQQKKTNCWTCSQYETNFLDRSVGFCSKHKRTTKAPDSCDDHTPKSS